jgi:hypothetical protein
MPLNVTLVAAAASLSIIFFTILLYYANGDRIDYVGRSMFTTNIGLAINYAAWLGIGVSIGRGFDENFNGMRRAFTFSWALLSLFFLSQIDWSAGGISFKSDASDKKSMYLLFADFYAVSALILMGLCRTARATILISIASAIILFFLSSRASLFFFVLTTIAYGAIARSAGVKVSLVIALLVSAAILPSIDISRFGATERMTVFFERGLQADASFIGRMRLLSNGVVEILNNPLTGAYNSLVDQNNNVTSYIHNILSYWQLYGFFVFALMTLLLIYLPAIFIKRNLTGQRVSDLEPSVRATCLISIFVLLQVITARAYVWHFSWLLIGIMCTMRSNGVRARLSTSRRDQQPLREPS